MFEGAVRLMTGVTLILGVAATLTALAVASIALIEWAAKPFRVYKVLWEFIYYKFSKRKDFLLEENAELRAALEKLRKEGSEP